MDSKSYLMPQESLMNVKIKEFRLNYRQQYASFGTWSSEKTASTSVVVETVSETSHLCWNNETIRFKSSLTSIIIEFTYLTLNMNKIWGCFKVQAGWKNAFYGETGSQKGLGETLTIKKTFLTFTLSVNKIIIYQFSMFKSLDYSLGSWNFYVPDNLKV